MTKGGQWWPSEPYYEAINRAKKMALENPGYEYHIMVDHGHYIAPIQEAKWVPA